MVGLVAFFPDKGHEMCVPLFHSCIHFKNGQVLVKNADAILDTGKNIVKKPGTLLLNYFRHAKISVLLFEELFLGSKLLVRYKYFFFILLLAGDIPVAGTSSQEFAVRIRDGLTAVTYPACFTIFTNNPDFQ